TPKWGMCIVCDLQFFGRIFWTNDARPGAALCCWKPSLRWARGLLQGTARKSGKDDYDKFSLPTGSGFIEDFLKLGARRLISDAQFDRSAPKRFSCNEMKC